MKAGRLADVTKQELIDTLYDFLLGLIPLKASAVLIIDEAQNLPLPVLEQIRILSNLETDKEKLLQIILVGQLNLQTLLRSPELRQLDQRVSIRYRAQAARSRDRCRVRRAPPDDRRRVGRGRVRAEGAGAGAPAVRRHSAPDQPDLRSCAPGGCSSEQTSRITPEMVDQRRARASTCSRCRFPRLWARRGRWSSLSAAAAVVLACRGAGGGRDRASLSALCRWSRARAGRQPGTAADGRRERLVADDRSAAVSCRRTRPRRSWSGRIRSSDPASAEGVARADRVARGDRVRRVLRRRRPRRVRDTGNASSRGPTLIQWLRGGMSRGCSARRGPAVMRLVTAGVATGPLEP